MPITVEEVKRLRSLNLKQTRHDLQRALAAPDRRIIQVSSALEEMDSTLSVSAERLREWYSLYYPEASRALQNHETFVRVAAKASSREDFKNVTQDTIGADFSQTDLEHVREYARSIDPAYEAHEKLNNYLDLLMSHHFPNLYAIAGKAVGAKLLALAGDSTRLARMPSSTIQVLGAEKALFRHLTTGAKPPKYGVILQHNLLQNAPKHLRGKLARALAAKASIAIRADVYGGSKVGEQLKKDLEKRVNIIMQRPAGEKPADEDESFTPREQSKPFKPRGESKLVTHREQSKPFKPRDSSRPFTPRDSSRSFKPRGGSRPFTPRGGSGSFKPRGGSRPFTPRGGSGSFASRGKSKPFASRTGPRPFASGNKSKDFKSDRFKESGGKKGSNYKKRGNR